MRSLRRPIAVSFSVLAVLSLSLALTTAAVANNPAVDEYVLDIPEATGSSTGTDKGPSGGGGGSDSGGSDGGSSSSGGDSGGSESAPTTETTEPPPVTAPEPSTPDQPSQGSAGDNSNKGDGAREFADQPRPDSQSGGPDAGRIAVSSAAPAAQTVPAIATDVADEGGMPLLLAGLAGVAALGLFFAHRRRQAQRG